MNLLRLAWRQLRRDLASGDVRILIAALVLAVMAVSAVGLLTDRAGRALAVEANRVLGGDAVLRSDTVIRPERREAAVAAGLQVTETVEFPSMIRAGQNLRLGELRALGEGFPLRGEFRLQASTDGSTRETVAPGVPAPGTVWLGRAAAEALGAQVGDRIGIGTRELTLAARVSHEPDAALDYFNIAPRVFLNLADLASTGLVQEGSRISYRLIVAGDAGAVEAWVADTRTALTVGQRLETASDARPEIRAALDRADRFLGLAALVSVVLAAIAVAMAARRHSARHLPAAAVLRSLGASQATLLTVHLGELLMLGLFASGLGALIAYGVQALVGLWLSAKLGMAIPPAGLMPVVQGMAVGVCVLLAFAAPPVLALRRVPALRVLRQDLDPTEPSAWLVGLTGLAGIGALVWWKAGSPALATAMLTGIAGTVLVLATLAGALVWVVRRLRGRLRGVWRYGLANVARRPATAVAQITALGLGLMVLLLLGFVRTGLLDRWREALPVDAPNRFIVNVQPGQVAPVREFFQAHDMAAPDLFPMIQARLLEHNGKPVQRDPSPATPASDGRSERLARRQFNLSSATGLRADNEVVAGQFWSTPVPATPELSVEVEMANDLGWKLDDRVAFDIAGQRYEARITSFRKVDWQSFKPNFFVLGSPGSLDGYAGSFITAVKVPATQARFTADLVAAFPNISVIDVEAVLDQVRSTIDQVSRIVEVVFLFSIAAGLLVLMAAVSASQDERLLEGAVMRVLGGSRRQLRWAQVSEFAAIGLLAGATATIAATVLGAVVAKQVLDLPWQNDWRMAICGAGLGMAAALAAGLFATRQVVNTPPALTLRALQP